MRVGINAHLLAFSGNYRQAGLSRHIYEVVTRVPGYAPRDKFIALVGNAPVPPEFSTAMPRNLLIQQSRLPTHKAPVRIAWEQSILPIVAHRRRMDLLHCPVNVVPILSPIPMILTIHDMIFMRYPQGYKPAKRLYLTVMTKLSVRRARKVIAVSEATRDDILEFLPVHSDKVVTVYNGVSENFTRLPKSATDSFMSEKGVRGRVILSVGTLEPRKNIETAIRAFAQIADDPEMADVQLVIGGSKGWYYDTIFAEAEQSGLVEQGRILFLGRVPDEELPLWYNVAMASVHPSRYEGFGLPALESMACGTPVITSTTAALSEVVGDSGIKVSPDDVGGWSNAMRTLMANSSLRAELAAKGIKRASDFSWDRCAQETLEVYRACMSEEVRSGNSPR